MTDPTEPGADEELAEAAVAEQLGEEPAAREAAAAAERQTDQESEQESAQDSEQESEEVREPSKLVRLSRMIQQLLSEIRDAGLDEQTRVRVRDLIEQTVSEIDEALSPDLRDELARLRALWETEQPPSQAELLIEQAQLTGWLEGVLNGIKTALSMEQAQSQAESNELSQLGGQSPMAG